MEQNNNADSGKQIVSKAKTVKIIKTVLTVLLSAILLFNVATLIISGIGMRRSLNYLPCAFVTVESGSMKPELEKGDLIFVYRTSFDKLKVGDVITYYSGEEFITHGIVRIENEKVITQGLQNEEEDDTPIDEKTYCAKMVFAIPKAAAAWEILGKPWMTVLLSVLIFLLLFGREIISFIYDLAAKAPKRKFRVGLVRVLAFLTLTSSLLTVPAFSSAKYKGSIGGVTFGTSQEVFFKSNYLSAEGKSYVINGWSGIGYDMYLEFRNWASTLLYNENFDVSYTVRLEKIVDDDYVNKYTLELVGYDSGYQIAAYDANDGKTYYVRQYVQYEGNGNEPNVPVLYTKNGEVYTEHAYEAGLTLYTRTYAEYNEDDFGPADELDLYLASDGAYGPFTLEKAVVAGDLKTHTMHLKMQSNQIEQGKIKPLTSGTKIRFRVTAETVPGSEYHQVLTGIFTFEVASATDFIGTNSFEQTQGVQLATYSLQTNRISGVTYRTVVFIWNPDELQLNKNVSPVWNYLNQDPNCYKETEVNNVKTAKLTLTMSAPALNKFQFFKTDVNKEISAMVERNVGANQDEDHITFTVGDYLN